MSSVLKVDNLVKYFGKKLIIDNLSIEVNSGEVYGFLGPNGSGKTTTIKMILGLLDMDSGSISIAGFDRQKDFEKALACIGGIVENPDTYGYLTAYKNLEQYQRAHGKIDKKRIDEVIKLVGLGARAKDRVKRYSLGMKQRLGLAQAIIHHPQILILDEPTNGLDPAGIRELRDILKKLAHEEGIAVLVSSHLLSEMQLMCDRVCIIDKGAILSVKNINELIDDNGHSAQRFKLSPAETAAKWINENMPEKLVHFEGDTFDLAITKEEVPQIITAMVMNQISIMSVSVISKSLEDSFMEITGGGNEIA